MIELSTAVWIYYTSTLSRWCDYQQSQPHRIITALSPHHHRRAAEDFYEELIRILQLTKACLIPQVLSTAGGLGSSVGIATGYGLDGPGIETRWEARFSAPVQTGPGVHPASCAVGTGSFPEVESGRGVTLTADPSRPSSIEV
jgi:hypothetical protein